MNGPTFSDEKLERLQRDTFSYFLRWTNRTNGLVADTSREGAPASIAAVGFAMAAYTIAAERAFITRSEAVERTLATLRFFSNSQQGEQPDATGNRGFYYHFLDMKTGRRAGESELSTIDTALLLAGALTAAVYFDQASPDEREIRTRADALYRRTDWRWAQNGRQTVTHGWSPEGGFLKSRWEGFDEALILYALGLGSPTYPLAQASYDAWTSTFKWKKFYGHEFLYAGPLFIHQFSSLWIDFRGIQDDFTRAKGIDYFESSRRAAYVQQRYAIRNPRGFKGYGEFCWGITASDGPDPARRRIDGTERRFLGYRARGVPYGPDDGTIAGWAVVTSLACAPEIVLPTLGHLYEVYPETITPEGFLGSFNPTFPDPSGNRKFWACEWHYGINQGPVVLAIENYRSGLLWRLMRTCPYLVSGLRRACFSGGWLSGADPAHTVRTSRRTRPVSASGIRDD